MFWTPERVDAATTMWVSGKSLTDIADHLGNGATKNSVAGKIDRLGLMNHKDRPVKVRKFNAQPFKGRSPRKTKPANVISLGNRPKAPPLRIDTDRFDVGNPFYPSENYVLFLDLDGSRCRWPFDSPRHLGTVYCGDGVMEGKSYCESHHCMSIGRSPRAVKRAA